MKKKSRLMALAVVAPVLPAVGVSAGPGSARAAESPEQVPETNTGPVLLVDGSDYDVYDLGDGWFEHRHAVSLRDAAARDAARTATPMQYSVDVIRGERVVQDGQGGCSYGGEVSSDEVGKDSDQVFHQREVRVNPDLCQVEVESAWISPDALVSSGLLPDDGDSDSDSDSESSSSAAEAALAGLAPTARTTYKNDGYIRGYVEDPPGVDVSSTTSQVKWTEASNGCLNWWHQSRWHWLSGTGWTDVQRWSYPHLSCDHGLRTFGKYKNGIFCLTNDTWTQENVDFHAEGHHDSWASWDVTKWGGCSWLLNGQHTYDPY